MSEPIDLPSAGGSAQSVHALELTDAELHEVSPGSDISDGGKTARRWVVTIQGQHDTLAMENAKRSSYRPPAEAGPTKIRYLVMQQEIGGETGRLHWQGYVEFSQPVRAAGVRKSLNCPWAWVKPARGTGAQARAYCTKDETRAPDGVRVEWGSMALEGQGKRNDLAAVAAGVTEGMSVVEVALAHPETFIRYHAGIQKLAQLQAHAARSVEKRQDLEVVVVCGPPGTGKSFWAREQWPDLFSLAVGSQQVIWFDGYDGQETLLIDDFQGGIPFRLLLNYLDIYAVQGPVKGGHVWLTYRRVVITSNLFYADWYAADNARRDMAALQRRITELRHLPAFGAEHEVWRRGSATDPSTWVPIQCPFGASSHAPGFRP